MGPLSANRLALAALLAAAGCAREIRADDPRVRYEGRVLPDGRGGVRIAWPRTAIHLRFRGTRIAMRVEEAPFPREAPQLDALGVEVDGGPMRRVSLREGAQEVVLAQGLSAARHDVRVVKLTEGETGTVRVLGVRLRDGAALLDAPPPRPRRLLVVGDSLSAGYGVVGAPQPCRGDASNHDAARAWPGLAADALGAELHVIAWSGRGLTRNYDPAEEVLLPALLGRTLPTDPDDPWDDARWPPTDIVLNVGTNDVARPGFDDARYADALEALIARAQRHAPDARLRILIGPMLFDDAPHAGARSLARVRDATARVVARRREAGYADTAWVEVPPAGEEEGIGCEGHPSAVTQRRMARQLAASLLGERGGPRAAPSPSPRPRESAPPARGAAPGR